MHACRFRMISRLWTRRSGGPSQDLKSENEQHRTGLNRLELWSGLDKPLVPCTALPGENGDVLLSPGSERHRRCVDATAAVELPQHFECFGIKGHDRAIRFPRKNDFRCCQDSTQHRIAGLGLADLLARRHVDRGDTAGDSPVLLRTATGKELPRLE